MYLCKFWNLLFLRHSEDPSLPIVIYLFRNVILLAPMLDAFSAAAAVCYALRPYRQR